MQSGSKVTAALVAAGLRSLEQISSLPLGSAGGAQGQSSPVKPPAPLPPVTAARSDNAAGDKTARGSGSRHRSRPPERAPNPKRSTDPSGQSLTKQQIHSKTVSASASVSASNSARGSRTDPAIRRRDLADGANHDKKFLEERREHFRAKPVLPKRGSSGEGSFGSEALSADSVSVLATTATPRGFDAISMCRPLSSQSEGASPSTASGTLSGRTGDKEKESADCFTSSSCLSSSRSPSEVESSMGTHAIAAAAPPVGAAIGSPTRRSHQSPRLVVPPSPPMDELARPGGRGISAGNNTSPLKTGIRFRPSLTSLSHPNSPQTAVAGSNGLPFSAQAMPPQFDLAAAAAPLVSAAAPASVPVSAPVDSDGDRKGMSDLVRAQSGESRGGNGHGAPYHRNETPLPLLLSTAAGAIAGGTTAMRDAPSGGEAIKERPRFVPRLAIDTGISAAAAPPAQKAAGDEGNQGGDIQITEEDKPDYIQAAALLLSRPHPRAPFS